MHARTKRATSMVLLRAGAAAVWLALLAPAVWHVVTLASLFRQRIAFPLDLEWMESGHLYHAYRIAHHLPIYVDPGRGFAPFPYPPLYWIVVAALGETFGLDYWTGRAVSVASIAGASLIFLVLLVRRAPTWWIGIAFAVVAIASIGAGYPIGDGTYDLARSDAFATFTAVVAAFVLGEARPSTLRTLATAAALTATIYAKQTGIFFAVWLIVFALMQNRRTGLVLAAATGGACALVLAILCVETDGWFWVWLMDQRHHEIRTDMWADPIAAFVRHAPFLLALPVGVASLRRRGWISPESSKWTGMLVAAVVGAMLAHVKLGGWSNLYTPVLVLAWPVSLLLACDLLRELWPNRTRALAATWGILSAASILLLLLEYKPAPFAPTARMWDSARRFHELVAHLDGEVVVTTMPFAAVRDGKRCPQPILQAYLDGARGGVTVSFLDGLDSSQARYVIVTGMPLEAHTGEEISSKFELVGELSMDLDTPAAAHPFRGSLWRRRPLVHAP